MTASRFTANRPTFAMSRPRSRRLVSVHGVTRPVTRRTATGSPRPALTHRRANPKKSNPGLDSRKAQIANVKPQLPQLDETVQGFEALVLKGEELQSAQDVYRSQLRETTLRSQDILRRGAGASGLKITVSVVQFRPWAPRYSTPAQILRGDRWMGLDAVARPGAAQGPHGEGGWAGASGAGPWAGGTGGADGSASGSFFGWLGERESARSSHTSRVIATNSVSRQ